MNNDQKTKLIFLITGILFILLFCILLIPNASASCMNIADKTKNSISWNYSNSSPIISASLDGIILQNFDNTSHIYSAKNLLPDSEHTFFILEINNTISNITRTLSEPQTEIDILINYIFIYLFFIVALGCIIIGLKIPFIALIGSGFAILGILDTIISQWFISFIFMCIFCAGIFVAFSKE